MFLSVRWCAEQMTQLCRFKVKVTLQGHGIYLWMLCPLHISSSICLIFINHHSNVPLSKLVCRVHDSATQTQGHSSRSWVFTLGFRVRSISPEPFERFSLNFTQIPLSELVQLCKLKVKVTLQGHGILWLGIWLSFRLLSCVIIVLNTIMGWSWSKLFDTLVFLKEFFKIIYLKKSADNKKAWYISQ